MVKICKETFIKTVTCCFQDAEDVNRRTGNRVLPPSNRISVRMGSTDHSHDKTTSNDSTLTTDMARLRDDNFPSGYTSLKIQESSFPQTGNAQSGAYESVELNAVDKNGESTNHTLHGYSRLSRKGRACNSSAHQLHKEQNPRHSIPLKIDGIGQKPDKPLPFSQSRSIKMLNRRSDLTSVIISGSTVSVPKDSFRPKVAMLPPARNNRSKLRKNTEAESTPKKLKDRVSLQASSATHTYFNIPQEQSEEGTTFESDYYELQIDFDRETTGGSAHYSTPGPEVESNAPLLKRRSEYDYNLKIDLKSGIS